MSVSQLPLLTHVTYINCISHTYIHTYIHIFYYVYSMCVWVPPTVIICMTSVGKTTIGAIDFDEPYINLCNDSGNAQSLLNLKLNPFPSLKFPVQMFLHN